MKGNPIGIHWHNEGSNFYYRMFQPICVFPLGLCIIGHDSLGLYGGWGITYPNFLARMLVKALLVGIHYVILTFSKILAKIGGLYLRKAFERGQLHDWFSPKMNVLRRHEDSMGVLVSDFLLSFPFQNLHKTPLPSPRIWMWSSLTQRISRPFRALFPKLGCLGQ